jgi:hypothetical protein
MFAVRRILVFISIVSSLLLLTACQEDSPSAAGSGSRSMAKNFQWLPMYGDGANDTSGVIARVGNIEITARDLGMYLEELPSAQQNKYAGPDGKRLLLKRMIDAVLMVQGAVEKKLYNDQDVARTIIAQRRNTLESAMVNYGLLRGQKPSDEEIRKSFMATRTRYRQAGIVNARHIECKTKDKADEAFRRLTEGGKRNDWMSVMVDFSVNQESKDMEGSVGWFNQGGIIPFIPGSEKFTNEVYGYERGLHPPFLILDRWHVVEVLGRENERPMSFAEAKDQVELAMMPGWQDAIVGGYLRESRKKHTVEMFGEFAPGQGLSPDELFSRALAMGEAKRKIELLNLLYTDYPESERADDALFLAANVALESWQDARVAQMYLGILLEEYPDSELTEDATFLQDNLYNPEVLNPSSIEALRK